MLTLRPLESEVYILLIVCRLNTHGNTASFIRNYLWLQDLTCSNLLAYRGDFLVMTIRTTITGLECTYAAVVPAVEHPLYRSLSGEEQGQLFLRYSTPVDIDPPRIARRWFGARDIAWETTVPLTGARI